MDATHIKNTIFAIAATAGSFIAKQLGGWDGALRLLVACMAADYVTGMVVAGIFKKSGKSETGALDSRAGFKGLVKKCAILMLVWLGALIDTYLGSDYVRTAICLFFIANEGLSILENIGLMGVPYPEFLKKALEAMKKTADAGQKQ
jgi:toxin secretion/phage lysis holin